MPRQSFGPKAMQTALMPLIFWPAKLRCFGRIRAASAHHAASDRESQWVWVVSFTGLKKDEGDEEPAGHSSILRAASRVSAILTSLSKPPITKTSRTVSCMLCRTNAPPRP